jgi:hypothetical protein
MSFCLSRPCKVMANPSLSSFMVLSFSDSFSATLTNAPQRCLVKPASSYAGYSFQKAGVESASSISFSLNGDRYEWRSRKAITESSGNWNVYALSEPPVAGETDRQGFTYGGVNSVKEFLSSVQ